MNQWNFLGLGICVDDLESASSYYSDLGYTKLNDAIKKKEWRSIYQEFLLGGVLFELIESEEESIYSDSIKRRGDGVAEIIFEVSDIHKEIDRLIVKGTQILQISDDEKMVSIQSGLKGNILTRLIEK